MERNTFFYLSPGKLEFKSGPYHLRATWPHAGPFSQLGLPAVNKDSEIAGVMEDGAHTWKCLEESKMWAIAIPHCA